MRKHPEAGSSTVSLLLSAAMLVGLATAGYAAQQASDPSVVTDFSAKASIR